MDSRNFTYMFYGFAAAWLILAAYVSSLVMRDSRLKSQMDGLRRMIEDKDSKS